MDCVLKYHFNVVKYQTYQLTTLSESYYLLLNYQAFYDARGCFAEYWMSSNKYLHMSAKSTV